MAAGSLLCRACLRPVRCGVFACSSAAWCSPRISSLRLAYGSQQNTFSSWNYPFYTNLLTFRNRAHRPRFIGSTAALLIGKQGREGYEATRNTKLTQKLGKVKAMKEDIVTIPNLLSSLRILAAPAISYLIIAEDFSSAALLFGAAGVTDLLDGYIARNFKNQKSVFGTALDPLADKILMSVVTISLTAVSLLPVPLAVLILGRDALLVATAFFLRYQSLPPPKSVARYFDVNLPTVELRPTLISKANTVLQLALVGVTLLAPVLGFVGHPHLQYFWYVVGGSTFLSGLSYVVGFKTAFKYIK